MLIIDGLELWPASDTPTCQQEEEESEDDEDDDQYHHHHCRRPVQVVLLFIARLHKTRTFNFLFYCIYSYTYWYKNVLPQITGSNGNEIIFPFFFYFFFLEVLHIIQRQNFILTKVKP